MNSLNNKKVLFISPSFFEYEQEIKKKMEELGASVHYIDDRPSNNTLTKTLIRLNLSKSIAKSKIETYFFEQLDKIKHISFDYVFVNTPEGFSKEIALRFKETFKNATYILYMWDSFENRPHSTNIIEIFSKKFSFDNVDAKKYGLSFRPLFYLDYYSESINNNAKYDLCFIGTAHTDRYLLVKKILNILKDHTKTFTYFYFQSPLLFVYNKIINKSFKNVKYSDIKYKALKKEDVISLIKSSKCIIDIHHPKQRGLTMRTLETLGANRKIITTNPDINTYDFFNINNVLVIDRENPTIDPLFLEKPFIELNKDTYYKYSIEGWLKEIFDNEL